MHLKKCDGQYIEPYFGNHDPNLPYPKIWMTAPVDYKIWEIPNFEAGDSNTYVFEVDAQYVTNGLAAYITLEVCDGSGQNCYNQAVEEDHPNAGRVSGLPIWIQNQCGYWCYYCAPTTGSNNGCDATGIGCHCYEKFYVIPNGDKWLISKDNTCATKCK